MSRQRPEKVLAWQATIDAWKRSGQSVNAFCRARQITRSNIDRWRRILPRDPSDSSHAESPLSAFVPVRVVAVPLGAAPEAVTRLVTAVGAASC